jgi:sugar lactone lactonase YvrE
LWVVSREVPQLLEISRGGRVLRRIPLLEPAASLWYGAGSVWLGFEGFGFERVDPKTGRATTFAEGNGVSAFAADGAAVYAVSHRDNTITRISLATGRSRTVTSGLVDPSTGSAEAAAFAGGSLWVTGRGLDLLRVSTSTGKVRAVTDIGPAGFVVSVTSGRIVVAGYSDLGARRGDPIVGSFSTVDPRSGKVVARTAATGTAYLSGFSTAAGTIFAADTVQGRLVRLAVPG